MTHSIIFERDEVDLVASFAGCSLDRSPGKNWVEGAGGLPEYICRIARAIHRDGTPISRAIAIAVSRVKKWAAGADDVDADTRAKAAKALAEWEALKVKNKAKTAAKKVTSRGSGRDRVEASNPDIGFVCLAKTDFNVDIVRQAFETQTRAKRAEWRAANPTATYDDGPPYLYIKEQWTSYLIVRTDGYRSDGKLFKVPYTVDAKQTVTFGEPVEVKTQYVAVPATEAPGADLDDTTLKQLVAASDAADVDALARVVALAAPRRSALERLLHLAPTSHDGS